MIEIQNVTKVYGKQTVLSCVSATLEAGKIYGLVGINGSGKTTLMRCICGFTHPTSGKIIVNGDEIGKNVDFPKRTGIIIETPGFLPHYSGLRNLLLLAGVSHGATKERAAQVMRQVKLDPDEKKPVALLGCELRELPADAARGACDDGERLNVVWHRSDSLECMDAASVQRLAPQRPPLRGGKTPTRDSPIRQTT